MVVIFQEMIDSGMSTLAECKESEKTPYDTVIAVYLAMRAIEQIAVMRAQNETIH